MVSLLTLFRIDLFEAAPGWRDAKRPCLPKICYTYPTMMKMCTVITYLKRWNKYINHVTHSLSVTDISKFFYIKTYRYKFHFDT